MIRRRVAFLVSFIIVAAQTFIALPTHACGHDGFYVGIGYTQLFMLTPQHRYTTGGGDLGRVHFSPGYGANALMGYDFCGSRWGIQMPFEFTRLKLNYVEWVNQFGSTLEGVLHLVEWESGLDIHLVGGFGWSYISEGSVQNRTAAAGITADLGPGLSYYFTRGEKISAALATEVPFRVIHYFGSHLSANNTTIFAIPIRISIQVGF